MSKVSSLWISLLMTIPVVPKIKILSVGSTPILLDDLVLVAAVLIGLLDFIAGASISGIGVVGVPSISVIFLLRS